MRERPQPVPPPDDERRTQLRDFAEAAEALGATDLAERARRLDRLPLDHDGVRQLALEVGPPELPSGLNPKALDHGAQPATEDEVRAFRRLERLHQAAEALRGLRAPRRDRPFWQRWAGGYRTGHG